MDQSFTTELPGFHYQGYNYASKNKQRTRYGCIKKGCFAKLYINEQHDLNSIEFKDYHSCSRDSHKSLEKRIMKRNSNLKKLASTLHKSGANGVVNPAKNTPNKNKFVYGVKTESPQVATDKTSKQQLESVPKSRPKIIIQEKISQSPQKFCEVLIVEENFTTEKMLKSEAVPKPPLKRPSETPTVTPKKVAVDSTPNAKKNLQDKDISSHKVHPGKPKPFRLTIQIDKIYHPPCPKSKKRLYLRNGNTNNPNSTLENNHQCLVCKKTFTDALELYTHIKEHFACDICKAEFTSKKSLQKHYSIHKSLVKNFPYKCHVCGLLFETVDLIKQHGHIALEKANNEEGENRIQFCKSCNMAFRNDATFRKHLSSHVEKESVIQQTNEGQMIVLNAPSSVIFSCRICNKTFTNVLEIDQHTKAHMKEMKTDENKTNK